nr:hypothetical protein [uncultured Mucilaginibacter sp.]
MQRWLKRGVLVPNNTHISCRDCFAPACKDVMVMVFERTRQQGSFGRNQVKLPGGAQAGA